MNLKFGDYISVEQKRFVGNNEFYTHKVIGTLRSNKWMDVPAITHEGMKLHDHMEDVVACICCGVCEEEVIRYRIQDVKSSHSESSPSSSAMEEALRECELLLRMAYTELSMQNKNGIFTDTSLIIRINNAIEKAKAALSAPAPVSEERG